jgi:hypothetical protein
MKVLPIYFILAIFTTMLVLYIIQPEPEILIKYPSPQQSMSDVYVDDDGVCYRYKRQEVKS